VNIVVQTSKLVAAAIRVKVDGDCGKAGDQITDTGGGVVAQQAGGAGTAQAGVQRKRAAELH